jgi:hypothetical protein
MKNHQKIKQSKLDFEIEILTPHFQVQPESILKFTEFIKAGH